MIAGFSFAYEMIFSLNDSFTVWHTFSKGTLLIAGHVGVNAISKFSVFCLETTRSGQILQSKGFNSGGRMHPFFESKNGHGTSSLLSLVRYLSEMSKVNAAPVQVEIVLNFTFGKSFFISSRFDFVKIGVSHKLCLRNEQQNLQFAQSDLERIAESILYPKSRVKFF